MFDCVIARQTTYQALLRCIKAEYDACLHQGGLQPTASQPPAKGLQAQEPPPILQPDISAPPPQFDAFQVTALRRPTSALPAASGGGHTHAARGVHRPLTAGRLRRRAPDTEPGQAGAATDVKEPDAASLREQVSALTAQLGAARASAADRRSLALTLTAALVHGRRSGADRGAS